MSDNTSTLIMPDLGDNADSGTIVRVAVKPGDTVDAGATVFEVETDKVVLDIPLEVHSRIDTILVAEGEQIQVGQALIKYQPQDATHTQNTSETDKESSAASSKQIKTAAQVVTQNQSVEAPIPQDVVPIATVKEPAVPAPPTPTPTPAATAKSVVDSILAEAPQIIPAGPSARRMAREIGVVLADVKGQGPKGRISVDDVKSHARHELQNPSESLALVTPLPDQSEYGEVHRERLTGIEKVTSDNMRRAWREIPHAWINAKINIRELQRARKRYKKRHDGKASLPSVTVFILKAVAMTAKEFPKFNASLDLKDQSIVYRNYFNVGVAVDTPRGLVVPVIRDVDTLSVGSIGEQYATLVERARRGALTPQDMRGGSITISNLGGFGVDSIYPMINWPQSAIIGLADSHRDGKAEWLPVTLAFDHRLINGADAARFIRTLRGWLEDPVTFALSV